jgi:hypothetical protein
MVALSASEAPRLSVGAALVRFMADLLQDDLAAAREVLTEAEMATACEEGQSQSSQSVVTQARVDLGSADLLAV